MNGDITMYLSQSLPRPTLPAYFNDNDVIISYDGYYQFILN